MNLVGFLPNHVPIWDVNHKDSLILHRPTTLFGLLHKRDNLEFGNIDKPFIRDSQFRDDH